MQHQIDLPRFVQGVAETSYRVLLEACGGREVEVLQLIAQGKSNREIGEELVISEGTARRQVSNIYDKIRVTNRAEATRYGVKQDLISQN